MKKIILLLLFCFSLIISKAQTVQVIVADKKTSLRGLSVVSDKVIWVSGSNGTVGKSIDGGDTFTWMTVKGFEKTDFRDIEAFDAKTAIIMGVDAPAYILKTNDGGESWELVYENKNKGCHENVTNPRNVNPLSKDFFGQPFRIHPFRYQQ